MNATQLRDFLTEAIANGLHPDTEVVIADADGGYHLISEVTNPALPEPDYDCWVTLFPSDEEADCRFTPAHFTSEPAAFEDAVARVFAPITAKGLDQKARRLFP